MTELMLTEEVFLLGHDDDSGRNRTTGLVGALAGAVLLDLALDELIVIKGKDSVIARDTHSDRAVLETALQIIAAESSTKPRSVSRWLTLLPARIKSRDDVPLDEVVGRALVERGILSEEKGKVLGLFPTTRWPERDPEPERALRSRLRQVLLEQSTPTPDEIALVALAQSYDLLRGLVDKSDRGQARRTAERLRKQAEKGDVVSKAIGETVRATQAAVLAAVVAANAGAAAAAAAGAT